MSGITAVASSATHAASGADVTASGFVTGETVALSTSPTGTNYQWALASPSGSNAARVRFAGDDTATASFTPDVAGVYAISVTVDGVVYALRLTVTQLAQSYALEALRLLPVADAKVPAPSAGVALYFSATQNALAVKDTGGVVHTVNIS